MKGAILSTRLPKVVDLLLQALPSHPLSLHLLLEHLKVSAHLFQSLTVTGHPLKLTATSLKRPVLGSQTLVQMDLATETERWTDMVSEIDRQTNRQTNRQRDGQTKSKIDRQTNRQTDRRCSWSLLVHLFHELALQFHDLQLQSLIECLEMSH